MYSKYVDVGRYRMGRPKAPQVREYCESFLLLLLILRCYLVLSFLVRCVQYVECVENVESCMQRLVPWNEICRIVEWIRNESSSLFLVSRYPTTAIILRCKANNYIETALTSAGLFCSSLDDLSDPIASTRGNAGTI